MTSINLAVGSSQLSNQISNQLIISKDLGGKELSCLPIQKVKELGVFLNLTPKRTERAMEVLKGWDKRSLAVDDFFSGDDLPGSAPYLYNYAKTHGHREAQRALRNWGFTPKAMHPDDAKRFSRYAPTARKIDDEPTQKSLRTLVCKHIADKSDEHSAAKLLILPELFIVQTGVFDDLSSDAKIHRALTILNEWGKVKKKMNSALPKGCRELLAHAVTRQDTYPHAVKQLETWGIKMPSLDAMYKRIASGNAGSTYLGEHESILFRLIGQGANPSIKSEEGCALFTAKAVTGHGNLCSSTLRCLMNYGAELKKKNDLKAIETLVVQLGSGYYRNTSLKDNIELIQNLSRATGLTLKEQCYDGNIIHRVLSLLGAQIFRGYKAMPRNPIFSLLFLSRLDPKGSLLEHENQYGLTPYEWGLKCHGKTRDRRYQVNGSNIYRPYADRECTEEDFKTVLTTRYKDIDPEQYPDKVRIERIFNPDAYPEITLPEDLEQSSSTDTDDDYWEY